MSRVLMVVDMQKDFIDGSLGTKEAQAIVPEVVKKIREYRERGDQILFTKDTHGKDYLKTQEGKKLPVEHCIVDTPGWEICEPVAAAAGQGTLVVFEKDTFGSREYARWLENSLAGGAQIEEIELAGLCTDICVISNALLTKAFAPQIPVRVDASCCAGVTPESHKNALEAMKMCQIEIVGA